MKNVEHERWSGISMSEVTDEEQRFYLNSIDRNLECDIDFKRKVLAERIKALKLSQYFYHKNQFAMQALYSSKMGRIKFYLVNKTNTLDFKFGITISPERRLKEHKKKWNIDYKNAIIFTSIDDVFFKTFEKHVKCGIKSEFRYGYIEYQNIFQEILKAGRLTPGLHIRVYSSRKYNFCSDTRFYLNELKLRQRQREQHVRLTTDAILFGDLDIN